MKSILLDIVQHTHSLGFIELVKITGSKDETTLEAFGTDNKVILHAKFKEPVGDFIGSFGMPNLGKLNTILNIPEYEENEKVTVLTENKEGVSQITGIRFENKAGDFKNDYRLMLSHIVKEQLKSVKFGGAKWDIDIVPAVPGIQRLKFQAAVNSEQTSFIAKVEDKNLKFYFGDPSTHAGDFVFQAGVVGKLARSWSWPTAQFISVLNLPGDKTLKFSDAGVSMITVDSGIADYNYMFPALTK